MEMLYLSRADVESLGMGIAIDDMVTAKVLLELARQKNIGTTLPL